MNICTECTKDCKNDKKIICDNFNFNLDIIKVDENFKEFKPAVRIK